VRPRFAIDDQDRYALSQRMIIVKTERLIAGARRSPGRSSRRRSVSPPTASGARRFIFMMGSGSSRTHGRRDVADALGEEAEAANESGCSPDGCATRAPRSDNATRRMSELRRR
jgi:hypothetical protein